MSFNICAHVWSKWHGDREKNSFDRIMMAFWFLVILGNFLHFLKVIEFVALVLLQFSMNSFNTRLGINKSVHVAF